MLKNYANSYKQENYSFIMKGISLKRLVDGIYIKEEVKCPHTHLIRVGIPNLKTGTSPMECQECGEVYTKPLGADLEPDDYCVPI